MKIGGIQIKVTKECLYIFKITYNKKLNEICLKMFVAIVQKLKM